ncbi:MAG: 2-amino-4-hydroxy-6-hydroxymethyldihydropteridine diphosphokinase [Gammaproteobacteria bacterium]|nr:2-amino-4-hydroxy-6-hydroxymethyldihydropteridine diphosphokinase [Gammaproteobacteria bacterium]NIX85452.1 2-amino-4-hydroxy-6-hydroxymethyldihydropteridine diphosphokinase [Gammaproteobacteria bacterium]
MVVAVRAYVGLGSNLGDPVSQVTRALEELDLLSGTRCVVHSGLYRSAPMGTGDQPEYINAVAALDTERDAHGLFQALMEIEARHGRVRDHQRWGPRTLDLDLLIFGALVMRDEQLTLPHPGLLERNFVLYPLYEIAPGLDIPGAGPIERAIERCSPHGIDPVAPARC